MSTAIKLRAGQFLLEPLPTLELPMKDLELFDVVTQVGHMLCGEGIISGSK